MSAPGGRPSVGGARRSGWLRPGGSPRLSDHACWSYSSDDQRVRAVSSWLAEGTELGQRAMYVGDGNLDELLLDLSEYPALRSALDEGRLVVASATDVYEIGQPIQPEPQLAMYDTVVEQAITDGYTGLRVAADITPLVIDPALRDSHLRWEQYADR